MEDFELPDDSPMMKQYKSIKSQYPGTVVFFRMGDFYETFGDDAIITARVLDITLTARGHYKGEKMPLAGIPYHALDTYLHRMVKAGYKVAICEQIEDPKKAKGIVKRDVVRIVSPGTVMEDSMLQGKANNFLLAISKHKSGFGLAAVDISTGEFMATNIEGVSAERQLRNEIVRFMPSECLISPDIGAKGIETIMEGDLVCTVTTGTAEQFSKEKAWQTLCEHIEDTSGIADSIPSITAAGATLAYLTEMQKCSLSQIKNVKCYEINDFMMLDSVTLRNLELFGNIRDGSKTSTLFQLMDRTLTPMGSRTLRNWMAKPLMDLKAVDERLDAVEILFKNRTLKAEAREYLKDVRDLERLLSRSIYGSANARDVAAIKETLAAVNPISETLGAKIPNLLKNIRQNLDPCQELMDQIGQAIADEPPISVRDGSMIREGYNPELDELRDMARTGGKWMASLEETERARTGIKSLKIKYNKVFGYHIEIPISQSGNVPDNYTRKQTMSNAERFITPELKEKESQILTANERSTALEYEIFCKIRENVSAHSARLQGTAKALGELDALASLAELAALQNYVRPKLEESDTLSIIEGRHPVVESLLSENFIPNDTKLDMKKNRVIILTGPNMAGKSTYMRQIALIVLMAQMGSFVPAKSARLGMVDRIFTRVGAFDDLSRGQSTFMVEMTQVSDILNNATKRSLILLDELGRGTSTFDGLSIAWAVAEYVHSRKVGAKTIFATHYHQLNELEELLDGVVNYNIAVKEEKDDIIFLRKVIPGSTNRSYGVQVAKLAGMPREVVERAKKLLKEIEDQTVVDMTDQKPRKKSKTYTQLVMFQDAIPPIHPLEEEILKLELDHLTPMQALQKLHELKSKMVEKK
ncbi:MAG: DNA mismatch repair protein MutS [Thermoplasmata archaeon]|nr:DNA mismatch repair protein MutS [Thermoplasmata archaeon]